MALDAVARNDELIDRTLIRRWLLWGLFWLMLAPTVGVVVSTKFNYPTFFGEHAWSTFGRLRPVHVNGVIWGAFSTLFIGLCYYVTPRLAGVRVWNERWAYPLLWIWNLNLAAAVIGLTVFGSNRGWEAGELALPNAVILIDCRADDLRPAPDDDRTAHPARALREPLVPDRGLRLDGHQPHPAPDRAVPHRDGHQQRGPSRPVHPLRRRALDHPGGLRAHLLLPARVRPRADLQPQAVADRLLVARLLLPVRRHPPLPLQPHRRLGGDHRDHLVDDADHPGVDGAPELLRHHDRALGRVLEEPAREVPDRWAR